MLLLRHASAGSRLDSPSLDRERPLDGVGRVDAHTLPHALAGYPIAAIVSSPHRRCVDTVRRLADSLGVEIEAREELAPEAPLTDTTALLAQLSDAALVCTHREVIERLFDGAIACEKGGAWIVESRGSRLVPTDYLPPALAQARERRLASLVR